MLTKKLNIQLVISRYKENITWIDEIKDLFDSITIYNKGTEDCYCPKNSKIINLENRGRETQTFLHHIIENYNFLQEYTHYVFCQGNPFDHCKNFINQIRNKSNYDLNSFYFRKLGEHQIRFYYEPMETVHPNGLPLMNFFYHLFFDTQLQKLMQTRHSMMIIPSSKILFRSINFYKYLFQYVDKFENPLEGYIIERLWYPIFDGNTKDWITHYYSQRRKFLGVWNNKSID